MIIEKQVSNIDDTPIVVKKKNVPQSTNKSLPMLFNTSLYIGSKGTGKTYKLCELLRMYENNKIKDDDGIEYEMRTILICPTASSGANEVYKILKSLNQDEDVHTEYTDEMFLKILDDIKAKATLYDEYIRYKKVYDKFMKYKNIEKLDYDELDLLNEHDYMTPDEVYGEIKPAINWIIMDDLIGSGAFNKKAKSVISNTIIKHRHLRCNLVFTTQAFKSIPPVIRTNIDIYCIFKSSSYNEILNKIHEDISGFVKYDDFIEAYEHATEQKHDCLTIINNSMGASNTKLFKNWGTELIVRK
jgi:hypothetical protein